MQSREEFRFINNFAEIIKTVTECLNKAHVLNFESMMQNKYWLNMQLVYCISGK